MLQWFADESVPGVCTQIKLPGNRLKDIRIAHKITFSHVAGSLLEADVSLYHQALSQTERDGEYAKREAEQSPLMDI